VQPCPPSPVPRGARVKTALLVALATAALVAACSDRGALSPPTLEPLLVHVDGPWLRDAKGRVVLLRGANVVSLEAIPPEQPVEVREQEFQFLARLGFNFVRLPIPWIAVEPRPGTHDLAFLYGRVDPLLRAASDHGMQVILALQQARWSSCFLGDAGAPPWTCAGADAGPPSQRGWGARDAVAELRAARAQCNFYRDAKGPDGIALRERYATTWRAIAGYYEQDRRIFGFDLLNEPSPGSCFGPDAFLADVLTPFYRDLQLGVRQAGAPQAVVYQPALTRSDALLGIAADTAPGSIFAPHLFSQAFGPPPGAAAPGTLVAPSYARAAELARTIGGPLVVGEIGGDAPPIEGYRPVSRELLAASLDQLDRGLASGAVWALVERTGGAAPGAPGISDEDAAVLARPFARRIAGIPQEMRFDAGSGEFHLRFVDDGTVKPPDPSEIFVPAERRYPGGFSVEVSDGDQWTFDAHNQRVLLYRGPGATHEVTIRPAPGGAPAAGDAAGGAPAVGD
jgi:endoglycosylceramidase